uniref:Uncharacterized protein n=1 Tax=Megaselia scalaris TaxID=36166 RepID=T1H4T4_MEGSC
MTLLLGYIGNEDIDLFSSSSSVLL